MNFGVIFLGLKNEGIHEGDVSDFIEQLELICMETSRYCKKRTIKLQYTLLFY